MRTEIHDNNQSIGASTTDLSPGIHSLQMNCEVLFKNESIIILQWARRNLVMLLVYYRVIGTHSRHGSSIAFLCVIGTTADGTTGCLVIIHYYCKYDKEDSGESP